MSQVWCLKLNNSCCPFKISDSGFSGFGGTNTFTLDCWLYFPEQSCQIFGASDQSNGGNQCWAFATSFGGYVRFTQDINSGTIAYVSSAKKILPGWHRCVFIAHKNPNYQKLYVDNIYQGQYNGGGTNLNNLYYFGLTATNCWAIGGNDYNASKVSIYSLTLYFEELSEQELLSSPLPDQNSPLWSKVKHQWIFDDNGQKRTTDLKQNFTLVSTNYVWDQQDPPPFSKGGDGFEPSYFEYFGNKYTPIVTQKIDPISNAINEGTLKCGGYSVNRYPSWLFSNVEYQYGVDAYYYNGIVDRTPITITLNEPAKLERVLHMGGANNWFTFTCWYQDQQVHQSEPKSSGVVDRDLIKNVITFNPAIKIDKFSLQINGATWYSYVRFLLFKRSENNPFFVKVDNQLKYWDDDHWQVLEENSTN